MIISLIVSIHSLLRIPPKGISQQENMIAMVLGKIPPKGIFPKRTMISISPRKAPFWGGDFLREEMIAMGLERGSPTGNPLQ
jgi:hypothetical protein